MAKQYPVSLQIPVIQDQLSSLIELLNGIGNPVLEPSFFDFTQLPNVHFARWLIAPAATTSKGEKLPASLIYSANVDGKAIAHLERVVAILPEALDKILSHCTDYPVEASRNIESRLKYLQKYSISTPGFYAGAPNRTVEQVKNEQKLHLAVREYVDANKGKWGTSKDAYKSIKEHLASDPQWDWARQPYKLPRVNWFTTIALGLIALILLPFVLIMLVLIHFFYEKYEKPFGITMNQVPQEQITKMKDQEDIIYQNQLSQVFETKTGLRRLALRFFLFTTNWAARSTFVKGQLMGTPTIHFARWIMIDGGKRFIFFSNFDGSFDGYLGDFVDNNGWGLNLIYGASVGYPTTFYMFGGGAYKINEFMGWGRYCQVQTQAFYSAYPWQGLQQIVDRSKFRTELFNSGELNNDEIKEMLSRI